MRLGYVDETTVTRQLAKLPGDALRRPRQGQGAPRRARARPGRVRARAGRAAAWSSGRASWWSRSTTAEAHRRRPAPVHARHPRSPAPWPRPTALRARSRATTAPAPRRTSPQRMGAEAGEEGDDAPIIRLVHAACSSEALAMRASRHPHRADRGPRARALPHRRRAARRSPSIPQHLQAPLISAPQDHGRRWTSPRSASRRTAASSSSSTGRDDRHARLDPARQPRRERSCMRLLDRAAGLDRPRRARASTTTTTTGSSSIIQRPNGIFLVTGPTGSGKTTTLYAALQELNRPDVKIITAEDPVEYHLAGINQVPGAAPASASTSRASCARCCARRRTSSWSARSATRRRPRSRSRRRSPGHLVFSTLHTNDAPSALTRLIDMGVKPFLVSAAVQAVMAQRLVRRLCLECRAAVRRRADGELARARRSIRAALAGRDALPRRAAAARATARATAAASAIFELLEMDAALRELTFRGASLDELRDAARWPTGGLQRAARGRRAQGAAPAHDERSTEVLRVTAPPASRSRRDATRDRREGHDDATDLTARPVRRAAARPTCTSPSAGRPCCASTGDLRRRSRRRRSTTPTSRGARAASSLRRAALERGRRRSGRPTSATRTHDGPLPRQRLAPARAATRRCCA